MAELLNMDYGNELQKKLVDKICSKLECDDDWDEADDFQSACKEMGLKRYKLDKQLFSEEAFKETHKESLGSSSSKDYKAAPKQLSLGDDLQVQIKVQNPAFQDMINTSKTTKSAAGATSAMLSNKGLLPAIITSAADSGMLLSMFIFSKICS